MAKTSLVSTLTQKPVLLRYQPLLCQNPRHVFKKKKKKTCKPSNKDLDLQLCSFWRKQLLENALFPTKFFYSSGDNNKNYHDNAI